MRVYTLAEAVMEFGESHRSVIEAAWHFLDEHEPRWQLSQPIDRRVYLHAVVTRVV